MFWGLFFVFRAFRVPKRRSIFRKRRLNFFKRRLKSLRRRFEILQTPFENAKMALFYP